MMPRSINSYILLVLITLSISTQRALAQTQTADISEADALAAVMMAGSPTAKLAAAEEFIAKFPNSTSRLKVAEAVVAEFSRIKNPTVYQTLFERAQTVFTSSQERTIFRSVALNAYTFSNRIDDAFKLAAEMLESNPEDLSVLLRITSAGAGAAQKRSHKYSAVALQYGLKAIALIEAGKKPSSLDDESWTTFQARLGELYQDTAILYLASNDTSVAKLRLAKAATLNPQDPTNFALLGRVLSAEYMAELASYESLPEGSARLEARKKLETDLDAIIELYARATGLATGQPEYQVLLQQIIPDLTSYYRQRNSQSVEGLQRLINKYRIRLP